MKTIFEMPLKAQKIITAIMVNELYQENFMGYVAQCLRTNGYPDAANFFWNKADIEREHFKRWSAYLDSRGVEAETPPVEAPNFNFVDLKSAVEAILNEEIKATEMIDSGMTNIGDADNMTHRKLGSFLDDQEWRIADYTELMKQLNERKDIEDQKEFSEAKWGNKIEMAIS